MNSFRYWLATLLMFCIGMTAQAQKNLTVGTSEHGTVTFSTEDDNHATTAAEGKTVTVNIAPAGKGWKVDKVTATAYTSWDVAGARGAMPTTLPAVKVIAVDQTAYTFTMPAYNVQVDVTYKTTSLDGVTIAAIPDQTYTGFQIKPTPEVKDGETVLAAGTDFTFEYGENINVATGGTVTIKPVEGSGFEGSKTVNFNIVPKSINADKISVDAIADQPYTGSQIKPAVVVKDGDRSVTLGAADYDLSYGENINVATGGTVTITGKGNYKDSREVSFKITKVAPAPGTVPTVKPNLTYNGKDQVLIVDGQSPDGTYQYTTEGPNSQNWSTTLPTGKNAKEYDVWYKLVGNDNHNDGQPTKLIPKIGPAKITGLTLNPTSLVYNAKEQGPALTVTAETSEGTLTLTANDYTASDHKKTDVGNYNAKVVGKGNFTGETTAPWSITQSAPSVTKAPTAKTVMYNAEDQVLVENGTATGGDIVFSTDGTNWSTTLPTGKNAKEYPIQWKVKGDANHSDSEPQTITGKITPAPITEVNLVKDELVFNGKKQTVQIASVKATVGDKVLTLGTTDYEIVNGTNEGTVVSDKYKIQVTGKGNFTGTGEKGWKITQASIKDAVVTLNPTEYTYDGTAKKPAVTVKVKLEGDTEFTTLYYNPDNLDDPKNDFDVSYEHNVDAGTATATITGKGNYKESTTKDFTIKPAELQTVTLENNKLTYIYNTEQTVKITSVTTKNGLTVAAANYTVSGNKGTNAKSYTLTVTAKANTNYTGSATATWEIQKKSAKDFTVELDKKEFTYDGNAKFPNVTVKDGVNVLTENTDYTLEFRDNKRAGINTAKVIVTGINNYTDKKEDVTFSILRADGEVKADPEQITMTYGLDPQTATVKIVSPTDLENYYFVSSDENVATVDPETGVVTSQGAGVATIYVVVMADNNYESMYAVCQVIVKPVEIVEADVTEGEAGSNGIPTFTVKKFGKTLVEGEDYTLEFFDKNEVKQNAAYVVNHAGDYMAVLTFCGNYYGIVEKKFKATGLTVTSEIFIPLLLSGTSLGAEYDFNGDGEVNIADLQALLNLEVGLTPEGDPISSASRASVNAEDAVMSISTNDLGGGVTRYALSLEGNRAFSAFQMDVVTTGSMQVVGEQAASNEMTLRNGTLRNGSLRIIGFGTEQSGPVVYIDVMGEGSLSIGNICFSTQQATAFFVRQAGDATGISLTTAATAEGDIFGLGGQRQQTLQKGVNIVRGQNGKSVKVLRK